MWGWIPETGRLTRSLAAEAAISRASARQNRVEFAHGGVTEWFVNGAAGVEQGFTVASKRAGGPLELTLEVTGDYTPAMDGDDVVLRRDGKTLLRYAGLRSWDAKGRALASRAVVEDHRIRLVVDDSTASYPVTVDPVIEEVKFTGSDTVAGDQFGLALAVSGNTAVAGVKLKNSGTGGAYVLIRSGNGWTEQQKLTISDGSAAFGASVAVDGDTAVVSALYQTDLNGAVYVFTRAAGQWTQQAKLTAFDGVTGDNFGGSVAISGDTIVVGASGAVPSQGGAVTYTNRGQAYVFTRSGITWSYQAKLVGSGSLLWSDFGSSVAVSSDTAVVGASGTFSSGTHCGATWVFLRSGTLWTEQQRLTAPDCVS